MVNSLETDLRSCLFKAGLEQALVGFESDMLVLNLDIEKEDILPALEQLRHDLTVRLPQFILSKKKKSRTLSI